jgi:hypothetical protein
VRPERLVYGEEADPGRDAVTRPAVWHLTTVDGLLCCSDCGENASELPGGGTGIIHAGWCAQTVPTSVRFTPEVAALWDHKPEVVPSTPVVKAFAHHGVHYDPDSDVWYCEGAGIRISVIMRDRAAHLTMEPQEGSRG